MNKFTILVDTREKNPWKFRRSSNVENIESVGLTTGDYSIKGLENIVCIERKASVAEFAQNITQKRFINLLNRMGAFKYKFFILEFSIDDIIKYPVGSTIPRKLWRKIQTKSPFIFSFLSKIQIQYGIQVVFAGNENAGRQYTLELFKRIIKNESK